MSNVYNYLQNLRSTDQNKYEFLINWDKEKTVNLLIEFLNENIGKKYLYSTIDDINGNSADAIVLENSKTYEKYLEGHDVLHFDVGQLIDNRYSDNKGDIILLELNGASKEINLSYLIDTINSKHVSYSDGIKDYLETFVDFLIKRKLS